MSLAVKDMVCQNVNKNQYMYKITLEELTAIKKVLENNQRFLRSMAYNRENCVNSNQYMEADKLNIKTTKMIGEIDTNYLKIEG